MDRLADVPRRWQAAALAALTWVAHLPALRGGFVFDDHALVEQGAVVRGALWRIWSGAGVKDYWPLTWTALWAEWRLWGADPAGYHAVDLALHALTALLLWRVLRELRVPGAWLGALLFAVHPVTVDSAAWISETKNTLSALPFLAAVLAWIRWVDGGRRRHAAAAFLFYGLALLAKASVLTLPAVLLGVGWLRRGRLARRDLAALAPLAALAALFAGITVWFQHQHALGGHLAAAGLGERLGGAGWALAGYLTTELLPWTAAVIYAPWPVPPADPRYFAPLAALAALAAALWALRARPWARALALALGYTAVVLLPVLGLVEMAYARLAPISNHLQYLGVIGPAALGGCAVAALRRHAPRAGLAAAVALTGILAALTFERATAYRDDLALWSRAVSDAPESPVAHAQLAAQLLDLGRVEEARRETEQEARLTREPDRRARARAYAALLGDAPDQAAAAAREAVRLSSDPDVWRDAGVILSRTGFPAEGEAALAAAVEAMPDATDYRYQYGALLARQRKLGRAEEVLREGCRRNPGHPGLEEALAFVLVAEGRPGEALPHVAAALDVAPSDPRAAARIAELARDAGQPSAAAGEAAPAGR
ncbi:hypothetical protein [Anaeromyxobacter diazotrophicus]|uniref:O-GlcNAc transferase n=1 Tax=Anaeromyxobacter diazotrophicus TaxID=2590199 RepID=A0A7I9VKY7_9BACT|nr:hypothetical protein [Anaeromyxobacter diazotrophicus]GEJ57072.1 O-GlcNAc transferase [Anaeromyxobacter diazotrophicus]